MATIRTVFLILILLLPASAHAQQLVALPPIQAFHSAIEDHFSTTTQIQIDEIRQTKKYRWLSYVPSPGYSPFMGGFTLNMNLSGPLQEIRLNHTEKRKIQTIESTNRLAAANLKNSLTADYLRAQSLIAEYNRRNPLDSLSALTFSLATKKYNRNEITPTEYITQARANEEYQLSRFKEANAINEVITNLFYKAKMDAAASNAHLFYHP